ncbi:restriction endonuclease subunit S [Escherichia coli]|nr:restriction endonuclease subunit S [Escherichia coli]MDD8928438.1 restriction endonuclease subunit S [Escherichia coli]
MERLALMPKYEDYVDSGVEWLGDLPSHWDAVKMKFLFKDTSMKNKPNETLLSVTQSQGVVPREWVENRMVMPSGNLESFKFIAKGDFAISLRSFEGGLEYCHHDGIISPAYTVLKTKKDYLLAGYYKYLFKSQTFISELQTSIVGIREGKNISYEELQYSLLPIPAEEEQTRIANFLDKKTALIDEAISIKEQQISLLKERKQIIIQQAVTQGLDPNVPMKDSGVDWIGKVPAHWNLMSLRYAFEFLNSRRVPISAVERESRQGVYPYYGASGVIDYVDDYIFDEDLILIAEDGANLLSKSTPLAFVATGKYWVNNHAHIIKPKFHGFKYWAELLSGLDYTVYISGAAQPKLTRDRLASVLVPVPPKDEIQEIISFIEGIEPDLNRTIDIQKSQIEKLKEYKTTLINSAVTGKIKITPEMVEQ